jgi:predicted permease
MNGLGRDFRYAFRRLRATPTFTLFAVTILALGIGSTTAIYSAVHALLGPPPGVTTIDRLVTVTHTDRGSVPMIALSYGDYQDLRAQQTVFQSIAGWAYFRGALAAKGQSSETAFCEAVSGEYFDVLGVGAAAGRTLHPSDNQPGAPPVAVIGYGLWKRMFGGDSAAIGQLIRVNGSPFEIVGVAAPDFSGLFNNGLVPSAVWIAEADATPAGLGAGFDHDRNNRSDHWIQVRALLRPGRTVAQAQAEVTTIAHRLDQSFPIGRDFPSQRVPSYANSRPWVARATASVAMNEAAGPIAGPIGTAFLIAVGLVLLVACTNLANMTLARGTNRRHDITVRLALGASRWRLIREAVVESAMIAAAGGFLGILTARAIAAAIGTDFEVGGGIALHVVARLDGNVLAASMAATLLALLVSGVLPAFQFTRPDLRSMLTGSGGTGVLPHWRNRRSLIALQVAVSMILVSVAALCLSQILAQRRAERGLDLAPLAMARIDFGTQRYDEQRARRIADAALATVASQRGIEVTAVSSDLPIGDFRSSGASIGVVQSREHYGDYIGVSRDFFRATGLAIVKGESFKTSYMVGSGRVAIVSERTARALFGTLDAVGRQLVVQRPTYVGEPTPAEERLTVIGVVKDAEPAGPGQQERLTVYAPIDSRYDGRLVLTVRASGATPPGPVAGELRRALARVDPQLAITQVDTGERVAGDSNLFLAIVASFSSIEGAFALLLALDGLYGILSHLVVARTREIGVRIALGADRTQIIRMIVREGLAPVGAGIVMGLVLGAAGRMAMTPLFLRLIPAADPLLIAGVPLLMLAAGVVACYLPARRAARVDPNTALRSL